jgi:multidrug efflux pump subunit AcrB
LAMGSSPVVAAEQGGAEVSLAVLAATLVDVVDFFPVTFLFGVSKFLFSALALAFCLALLASFVVAMTVIPLFCSRFLKGVPGGHGEHAANNIRISLGAAALTPGSIESSIAYWIFMSAWSGALWSTLP